jgi:hypothetical protein
MQSETLRAIWDAPIHWTLKFVASAVAQGDEQQASLDQLAKRTRWADAVLRDAISTGCAAGILHVVSDRGPDGSPVIGLGAAWDNPLAADKQRL